jgi:hypothetical protein
MLTEAQIEAIQPVRYERWIADGEGLYLQVTPKGARYWHLRYRFAGKPRKFSIGRYPVVTLEWARSRKKSFRDLLARGIDPSALRAALGKHRFGVTMREWEAEQGRSLVSPSATNTWRTAPDSRKTEPLFRIARVRVSNCVEGHPAELDSTDDLGPRSSPIEVLLIAYLFQPIHPFAVEFFDNRYMGHRGGRTGAMPMLLARCPP